MGVNPFDRQVSGNHYKHYVIQPVEFITKNSLSYCEGNVIKYICRHRMKGGLDDLNKVIHYVELLKQLEYGDLDLDEE